MGQHELPMSCIKQPANSDSWYNPLQTFKVPMVKSFTSNDILLKTHLWILDSKETTFDASTSHLWLALPSLGMLQPPWRKLWNAGHLKQIQPTPPSMPALSSSFRLSSQYHGIHCCSLQLSFFALKTSTLVPWHQSAPTGTLQTKKSGSPLWPRNSEHDATKARSKEGSIWRHGTRQHVNICKKNLHPKTARSRTFSIWSYIF